MGWLSRFLGRFAEDEEQRRAASIREWAASVPGATLIRAVAPRTVCKVAGAVEGIRVRPREGIPAIEAVVTDGSGSVTAVWLGRRTLPGLRLGSRLVLEGRVGGDPARLQIVNPQYEFAPTPLD